MTVKCELDTEQRRLVFFAPNVDEALVALETSGRRRVVVNTWDSFAESLAARIGTGRKFAVLASEERSLPSNIDLLDAPEPDDVLVLNEFDPEKLSCLLLEYLDAEYVYLVAPITCRFFRHQPLFLISIPKGGTHLLYRLAESLGYGAAVVHNGDPTPGNWYCVEYSNSHTIARDFFIDSVRRHPFGNRHHPFPRSPALFIYRNPLDVVVSEANYYHRDGATVFSSYLRHLDFEHRLLRLIDDPYLLGSIRDRINNFIPWFDCENDIPVSFEELIGTKGGGDDAVRDRLVWSLQLRLHIPGSPESLSSAIFDESSPTFHEGRIGSSHLQMTQEALRRFCSLNLDFMQITGYLNVPVIADSKDLWAHMPVIPSRAEEFRHRPLRTSKEDFRNTPFCVEWNFLDHNIVRFDGRYFAISRSDGPVNLVALQSADQLGCVRSSHDLEALKAEIVMTQRHAATKPEATPNGNSLIRKVFYGLKKPFG